MALLSCSGSGAKGDKMSGEQWYVGQSGDRKGPFTSEDLRKMAESGELKPSDLIWKQGLEQWVPASSAKNLFPAQIGPPPLPSEEAGPPPLPADAAPPLPASGPRRTHATQAGGAGIPPWAKIAGGVVTAIVVLSVLGRLMVGSPGPSGGKAPPSAVDPRLPGSPGPPRRKAPPPAVNPRLPVSSGPSRGNAPPAVDPGLLVGAWTYSGSGPDGLFYQGEMVLNADGSFSLNMTQMTAGGQPLDSPAVVGTWSVNGSNLILAPPDPSVGAPMVKSIVTVDAGSLTVQNVDTGVVSRWLRGSGKARVGPSAHQPSLHDGGTGSGGGSGMAQEHGPSGRGRRAPASAVCPACKGARGLRCLACKGTGFDTLLWETCTVCRGTGIMRVCNTCNGTGKKPSVGRPLSY